MILNRMLCAALLIIGTLLPYMEGNEMDNGKHASTNPSFDDYPNYSDYVDNRDYPNLDYNDDREDRSLHGHHDLPNDDNDQQTDSEQFLIKQLKSTIPGTPGVDYALYQSVPDTSFKCDKPGFYGDVEAQCQVFHICQEDNRHDSFLCPVGTVFNQISFICDWWFNFNCEDTTNHYHLNNKFHSSTGSKSMKDAMKRMRNFQENKDMQMIMGLAKVHKNFHARRNINNRVSVKRSMSPKVKNLFMLRMRNKNLGEISNAVTSKNDNDITTNRSLAEGTHLELKEASSTGYIDITLSDYTTTINSSVDDIYYNASTPKTMNLNFTESISNHTLNQLSVLNTSPETTIYENVTMMEFEANTLAELITTMKNVNTTEISLTEQNSGINSEVNEFNSHSNSERETEKPLQVTLSRNETSLSNETLTASNPVEKETTTIAYPKRPFKHENNFVIGNDTHISISVTIHSKFVPSKLQWKRLPGIKRVRKIHFKNIAESFTPRKNPVNETSYRKRNYREKSKSRVMWIPVKKNNLDRTLDSKAFLEPRIPAIPLPLVSRKEEVHEMNNELNKAAVEGSEIPSIYIDFSNDDVENKTIRNSSKLLLDTETEGIDTKESNITVQTENFETELFLVEKKHQNLEQLNETGIVSDVGYEKNQAAIPKNTTNQNQEVSEHCKTICIKLLRSLHHANSSNSLNSTELEKVPSALTLFDYDSPEFQNNPEYGRKSLLEISSSEHWTVKYDPGPNCNENTEDGKVLIKGWSVIIDTGSVTKEKTVKKRGCTDNSKQRRFVIKENLFTDRNSGNRGIRFHTENSTKPFNSALESKFGSNDQRYWLNLVKNWLEQSSTNENQRTIKVFPGEKNSNNEQLFGSFSNFRNNEQYSNFNQKDERNENLGNHDMQNVHDFQRSHQEGLVDENTNLNLESRNAKQLDRKSKHSMPFKQIGIRKQFKIQNSKTDRYSDLQTERSDWFQATQKANERINFERNKRDSFGSYSDDYSETGIRDLKDDSEDDWIDGSTDDTDYSANQDKDEWLTKNFRESQNRHGTENRPNGDSWSASLWEQSKKDSMTPRGRNIGVSNGNFEWNLKNHQRTLSGYKNEKSDSQTKNWSSDSQEQERRRKDTIASQGPDMHTRNNKGEPRNRSNKPAVHGKRATSGKRNTGTGKGNTGTGKGNTGTGKGNTGMEKGNRGTEKGNTGRKGNTGTRKGNTGTGKGNTGTGKGNTGTGNRNTGTGKGNTGIGKGTSTGKGNTNTRKGYDGFIHSTRKGHGNSWSDDENSPSSTEGGLSRPKDDNLHTPKDRNRRKSWFSDEEQNWRRDSNSKGNRKNDEDWNKSTDDNKGSISEDKSDWSSEENYWNSEESYDSQDRDWNEQSENKKLDSASDSSSESDYTPDWSSSPRGGRNKGFVVHNKGSSTQLSHNEPTWGADSSATKSSKENGRTSDHAMSRKNTKGRTDSGFNQRGKEWSSSWNQSGRDQEDYDDETWIADNSRDTDVRKGVKMVLHWSTKPDLRQNVKPQNKGNRARNHNPKGNSSPKGTNTSPWADKIPPNPKANVNTERTRTSKGNSRRTSKGTMRRSESTSKGTQNRQKSAWEGNHNPRNSTKSKGNLDAKKIVWSVQISNDGKLGNGWVPITLRPNVKRNNETQNDWKGSSSRNGDWTDRQDSSIDKSTNTKGSSSNDQDWKSRADSTKDNSWNTKGSSSRDEEWKSVRDSSKNMAINNKGISLIDEDWRRKADSSEDSSWNTKGSSLKDEDWNNKDFPKDTDWNTEEWIGKVSTDENFNKGNSERSNKAIPNMKEWHSDEKEWSDKEDWKRDDFSTVNDWNGKSSNKDGSSDNGDWYSNISSPNSKARDERGNEKSKIETSMNPNWHNKDAKSTNLKADVSQNSQTISDQTEAIATEINPPIMHMTEESFSHLFYIPGYNFRYKRDYQNRDRHLKTRDTLKKSYKIIKSGEILDDASEDNDKFFLAKADIKVEGHSNYHEKNLKSLAQRTMEASIKNQDENPLINSDTKNVENNNEKKYEHKKMDKERLDISPRESVIREIWSSPFLSSNFSESGWIPITAVKPLKTINATKFNPATANKNINNLNLKNSSSTTDNINVGIYHSDNDYLIVKNISEESWSPSTSKSFNILFLNKTEEPAHIKNRAGEKTKENVENGTEMKVGNKTLRILSFSDVMKQFENRGESSEDNVGAQSTSYNVPITIHPKKYSLKLVDPSENIARNNSNSWRFSTNENGMKQTWVLIRRNETKQIHPKSSNTDESKKITDGKKLNLHQIIIGNKTMTSEKNNFTTDSLLLASNETSLSFTNWHNDSDWTPIIRTVGRVISYNRTLLLDSE